MPMRLFEFPQRRPARRGDSRWLRRFAEVIQNLPHGTCIGDKSDDPHLRLTNRADQWQRFVDARQQHRPQIVRSGTARWCVCFGGFHRQRHDHRHRHRCCDGGTHRRIGCQHTVVTMAMRTGWWDERGNLVDQFQRREHQITRAIGAGLGVVVDQMLGIQRVQMFQCKGRTGAVAQQPFQPSRSRPPMHTEASKENPPPCSQPIISSRLPLPIRPRRTKARRMRWRTWACTWAMAAVSSSVAA